MDLDYSHPDFSMSMELLASLPTEPFSVALKDLQTDLELDSTDQVKIAASHLRRSTFSIKTRKSPFPQICIAKHDGERAKLAAGAYLDKVYGG